MRTLLRNWKTHLPLLLAVLLPTILLGALRIGFTPYGQESSEDAFWHAAAGRRSTSEMLAKTFPLTLSVWRDHYADKELLFHFLLKGYCEIKALFHSELFPPFNGAAVFFIFLFFLAFVTAANSLGISPPNVLAASLLCCAFLPNFTYRLLMMRPHVLSMALMMFGVAILAGGPARKRTCAWMFGLSFLYSWSYSSPHLVCVTAFLFGAAYFSRDRWRAFSAFAASVAGVFCGLLIHPQTPNTLLIWKIQALDALLAPIAGSVTHIPFARELLPPRFRWILLALPALIGMYFCLMIVIRAAEKHSLRSIPPKILALTLSAFFWICAMCSVSIRPVEYAVPMLCLAGFLLIQYAGEEKLFAFFEKPWKPLLLVSLAILICGFFTLRQCMTNLRDWCRPAPVELAEALHKNVPKGSRVVNIIWSDFPYLYFTAPEYEYTWALDPMFGYAFDSAKVSAIGSIAADGKRRSPSELHTLTGADYAVVLFENNYCGRFLTLCGWRPLYQGKDGWIFKLTP